MLRHTGTNTFFTFFFLPRQALMSHDSRTKHWFPMFSYFESSVDGIIPNEFDTVSGVLFKLFECVLYVKDVCMLTARRFWIAHGNIEALREKQKHFMASNSPLLFANNLNRSNGGGAGAGTGTAEQHKGPSQPKCTNIEADIDASLKRKSYGNSPKMKSVNEGGTDTVDDGEDKKQL